MEREREESLRVVDVLLWLLEIHPCAPGNQELQSLVRVAGLRCHPIIVRWKPSFDFGTLPEALEGTSSIGFGAWKISHVDRRPDNQTDSDPDTTKSFSLCPPKHITAISDLWFHPASIASLSSGFEPGCLRQRVHFTSSQRFLHTMFRADSVDTELSRLPWSIQEPECET